MTTLPHLTIPFLVSLIVSWALTFPMKAFAKRVGFISVIREDRWKKEPVPLLGGLVVCLSVLLGFFLSQLGVSAFSSWPPDALKLAGLVLGGSFLAALIGMVDDRLRFLPQNKFVLQVLLSSVAVSLGLRASITGQVVLDGVLSAIWLVAIMNAFNLMDNMDGLAAGIGFIASVSSFALCFSYDFKALTPLLAAFGGGCLGFLIHNFSPAKIFLGDAGSLYIGFFLGAITLVQWEVGSVRNALGIILMPTLILLVPIFDMVFVSFSRIFDGRSPFVGGRDHVSHRLVVAGLSERKAVCILYLLSICGSVPALISFQNPLTVVLAALLFILILGFFAVFLTQIRVYGDKNHPPAISGAAFSLVRFIPYKRQGLSVFLDVGLIVAAYFLSYLLRFEDQFFTQAGIFTKSLPVVLIAQFSFLWIGRVYSSSFRHSSIYDLLTILKSVSLGSCAAALAVFFIWRFQDFSRTIFIIDYICLMALLCAFRLAFRLLDRLLAGNNSGELIPVLIYGAGDLGDTMIRVLSQNRDFGRVAIGFMDDDQNKRGLKIHDVRVLGGINEIEEILPRLGAEEIIVSSPKINGSNLERLKTICKEKNLPLKLPAWSFQALN